MVGQLVPIFQGVGYVASYRYRYISTLSTQVRDDDDRVLAGHLLLHHHSLDPLLPDQHPGQPARAALAHLRSVDILCKYLDIR